VKGPKVDAPQAAIDGFLKKTGLTKDQLKIEKQAKGVPNISFDNVTLDVKDKEGNKLYSEIHKQLKSKGIEFSI